MSIVFDYTQIYPAKTKHISYEQFQELFESDDKKHLEIQGLKKYLDAWWQHIKKSAGEQPIKDLLGTLTAALGAIAKIWKA